MNNIVQTQSVWQTILQNGNPVEVSAKADPSTLEYEYYFDDGIPGVITVNDTQNLIDLLQTVTDWINQRGLEDAENE